MLYKVMFAGILCLAALGASPAASAPAHSGSPRAPTAATPAVPHGAKIYFAGDSITYGLGINNQGTHGCSYYAYPSPCYPDMVSSHYGATEINIGTPSQCLEETTTSGSLCDTASSGVPALINSYKTTMLPYAGNNSNYFSIMIGTNDLFCAFGNCYELKGTPDVGVSIATFKGDLETIVAALENAGTPPTHIILADIPWGNAIGVASDGHTTNILSLSALQMSLNAAIADVAIRYGTLYSSAYRAISQCYPPGEPWFPNQLVSGFPCSYDGIHPNNAGNAALAAEWEDASQLNAVAAKASYMTAGTLRTVEYVTSPFYDIFTAYNAIHSTTYFLAGKLGQWGAQYQIGIGGWNGVDDLVFEPSLRSLYGVQGTCGDWIPGGGIGDILAEDCWGNMANKGAIFASAVEASGSAGPSAGPVPAGYVGQVPVLQRTSAPIAQPGYLHLANDVGQASCVLSSTSKCTASASVAAGVTCVGSYDLATTVSAANLLPILSSASAPGRFLVQTNKNLIGTVYVDYVCL